MVFWQDFYMLIAVDLEKPLMFGILAAFFGFLAIILDIGTYYLFRHKSFLKIDWNLNSFNFTSIVLILISYIFCAGIVGFLGSIVNVLNFNIQSALMTGFVWPTILSRIVKASDAEAEEQTHRPEEEEGM
ncbi:MAG: hypothetical protein Q7J35_13545 [Candidatus Methanoperedens sp.]|nr:hypothetical protein [Candidatus Methanoperedens sp.]